MNDENKELIQELIDRAKRNELTKFELLTSWSHRAAAVTYLSGMRKIVKAFRDAAVACYKEYLVGLKKDQEDFRLLLEMKSYRNLEDFYMQDIAIVEDMLDEYRCYIHSGHLVDALLGIPRREEDMDDYRLREWKLF